MFQKDDATDVKKASPQTISNRSTDEQVEAARILLGLEVGKDIVGPISRLVKENTTLWNVLETAKKVSQLELTGIRKQLMGILTLKEKK